MLSTDVNKALYMATTPTKTISARVDLATHAGVIAALRPGENVTDFLAAAVAGELLRRRAITSKEPTLGDLGQLVQASLSKASLSQSLLTIIDSKLNRLMTELDVQS